MKSYNHVGRIKKNNAKVLVAFRTLPGESNFALVVPVASLSDSYHDSLMSAVESLEAQAAFEFGEIMFTRMFADGRPMLRALQADGILQKVPTDTVLMTPTSNDNIGLDELNVLIAEQRNCAVDELCTFVSGAPKGGVSIEEIAKIEDLGRDVGEPAFTEKKAEPLKAKENEVLSDKDIAKSYRSQADAMYKEAARLRKEAETLDPTVKKTSAKAKEEENVSA